MNTEQAIAHARRTVLEHLAKEGAGRTFGHLLVACGFAARGKTSDGHSEARVLDRALQRLRKDRIIKFARREWTLVTGEGTCPSCQRPIGSSPDCLNCAKLPETLDALRGGSPDGLYVHVSPRDGS